MEIKMASQRNLDVHSGYIGIEMHLKYTSRETTTHCVAVVSGNLI